MVEVLIIGVKHDTHAYAAIWGLEKLGISAKYWDWADYPKLDTCALLIDGDRQDEVHLHDDVFRTGPKVVWNRRGAEPQPRDDAHEADTDFILSESREMIRAMNIAFELTGAQWINPRAARRLSSVKFAQLRTAVKCGLKIPSTCLGNSFKAIQNFLSQVSPGRIIYKPFKMQVWTDGPRNRVTETVVLPSDELNDRDLVEACPGIYQEYIEKAFELRIVVCGRTAMAARLDTQFAGERVDWRSPKFLANFHDVGQRPGSWKTSTLRYRLLGINYQSWLSRSCLL